MDDKEFKLNNLPKECQDPEITQDDFKFASVDKSVHEQKFSTKPTTFFKDSMKRFAKNKSSVVAAAILGALLLLSFIVPIADTNDIRTSHPEIAYLEPKLFNAGGGFWDGTKNWDNIPVDVSAMPDATTKEEKEENWWPNPDKFIKNGVTNKVFSDPVYTTSQSNYGKEGYIQAGYYNNISDEREYVELKTYKIENTKFDLTADTYLTSFDVYDLDKIKTIEGEENASNPANYVLGECALYFNYEAQGELVKETKSIMLLDYNTKFNIGSAISSISEERINITDIIKADPEVGSLTELENASFSVRIKNQLNHQNTCVLIRSIEFSSETSNTDLLDAINAMSFEDATACMCQDVRVNSANNMAYWSCTGSKNLFMSKIIYCSFVYDSYEALLGTRMMYDFSLNDLENYRKNKWIDWNYDVDPITGEVDPNTFVMKILDKEKCPIAEEIKYEDLYVLAGDVHVQCKVTLYKYYGYSSMPRFLFGTDKTGRDMLKYVFEGLRTSLLLGILTFAVCFTFGLIWGAICGYFGGVVDLLMERFTDILSGIPWIVVMTLVIIHLGSNFWTFALALCLTGWIGTAARTRTQFYRFRGREYVLASRTLGASDARLIAKHILPNALGTIITGAVLMIPSVIFSEATISYLGLGLKNLSSLGVILSNNQNELTSNAYLLIVPSVIIALLMICFNLFGNGLRDAINPSLKGEDE